MIYRFDLEPQEVVIVMKGLTALPLGDSFGVYNKLTSIIRMQEEMHRAANPIPGQTSDDLHIHKEDEDEST